jgi:hypothetical protein
LARARRGGAPPRHHATRGEAASVIAGPANWLS